MMSECKEIFKENTAFMLYQYILAAAPLQLCAPVYDGATKRPGKEGGIKQHPEKA